MKKTRKQIILDNDLSIPAIMAELETYKTGKQKAKFLREMGQLNLPYSIKWENLAQCHEGTKQWPSYKFKNKDDKDEDILKDTFEVSTSSGDDKPLTHAELEALI